jgi:hypothetical protein
VILEGLDQHKFAAAFLSKKPFRDQPADYHVTERAVEVPELADLGMSQAESRHLEKFRSNQIA